MHGNHRDRDLLNLAYRIHCALRIPGVCVGGYGTVASGEWIDVIRFRGWLKDRVQTGIVDVLAKADGKIPYTSAGIQVIVTALRAALDAGVTAGGIAPRESAARSGVQVPIRVRRTTWQRRSFASTPVQASPMT